MKSASLISSHLESDAHGSHHGFDDQWLNSGGWRRTAQVDLAEGRQSWNHVHFPGMAHRSALAMSFLDLEVDADADDGPLSQQMIDVQTKKPMFDITGRTVRSGTTPGYVLLRDESAPCEDEIGAPVKGLGSLKEAAQKCDENPACDYFQYVTAEKTALLCRGNGYFNSKASSNTDIGVKPRTVSVPGSAVLTNTEAICPPNRLLAERDDVRSIADAQRYCQANPECTHWTFYLSRFPNAPRGFKPRLRMCAEGMATAPREGAITVAPAGYFPGVTVAELYMR